MEAQNQGFYESIYGRVLAEDVKDAKGNMILHKGDLINKETVILLENAEIEMLKVRTPLVCDTVSGVCQNCYGMDLSTREITEI